MISILLILALLIAIIAVIFALQNTAAVTVSFFVWQFHESLALVLLLTIVVGVLIGIFTILPGSMRNRWRLTTQRKKMNNLEKMLQQEKIQREDAVRQLEILKNPPVVNPPVVPPTDESPAASLPPA
jgi:uncharacterized integral membrane protein